MTVRGVRGAIDVARNSRKEIFTRTRQLLRRMVAENRIEAKDVAAAFFTLTPDLNADFPAYAARGLGWRTVPMMCASELGVPGSMKKVVRIMLLVNTSVPPERIRHQYLGKTRALRPDLAGAPKKAGKKKPRRR